MEIVRYWDMTDEERAACTEGKIKDLCKFEMMEQGVIEPQAPELLDETEPEIQFTEMFEPQKKDHRSEETTESGSLFIPSRTPVFFSN